MKKFLKKLLCVGTVMVSLVSPVSAMVSEYTGAWYFQTNPEYLELGFRATGDHMSLSSTPLQCGSPGAPYYKIREVLKNNGPDRDILWWISDYCSASNLIRICVENYRGQWACSTYIDFGWHKD